MKQKSIGLNLVSHVSQKVEEFTVKKNLSKKTFIYKVGLAVKWTVDDDESLLEEICI